MTLPPVASLRPPKSSPFLPKPRTRRASTSSALMELNLAVPRLQGGVLRSATTSPQTSQRFQGPTCRLSLREFRRSADRSARDAGNPCGPLHRFRKGHNRHQGFAVDRHCSSPFRVVCSNEGGNRIRTKICKDFALGVTVGLALFFRHN